MTSGAVDTRVGAPDAPVPEGGCPCSGGTWDQDAASKGPEDERRRDIAVLRALGCSNAVGIAELRAGEVVLILSAGTGPDVILAAERVGPTGEAIGLDENDELLDEARDTAADCGIANVRFLVGDSAAIPLATATVDVVLGSYVTGLSDDKTEALRELARVLRPDGRLLTTEIVADGTAAPAGTGGAGRTQALTTTEFRSALTLAGFGTVDLTPLQPVARGLVTAAVRASDPRGTVS